MRHFPWPTISDTENCLIFRKYSANHCSSRRDKCFPNFDAFCSDFSFALLFCRCPKFFSLSCSCTFPTKFSLQNALLFCVSNFQLGRESKKSFTLALFFYAHKRHERKKMVKNFFFFYFFGLLCTWLASPLTEYFCFVFLFCAFVLVPFSVPRMFSSTSN